MTDLLLGIMPSHVSCRTRILDAYDCPIRNYQSQKISVTPFQSSENMK